MVEETLENRIFKATEELLSGMCKAYENNIVKSMEQRFQAKEEEVNKTLNKGFGLGSDPIAHVSDLIAHGRKAALEKAETAKRTPAAETPAGPDGNTQPSPIDQLFNKAKRGELT
jgi:hypothetical protein